MRDRELSDVADNCDRIGRDDENPSNPNSVGPEGEYEDEDDGKDVDGDGKQLGIGCAVTEFLNHSGDCSGESVHQESVGSKAIRQVGYTKEVPTLRRTRKCLPIHTDTVAPVHEDKSPELPIREPCFDVIELDLIVVRYMPFSGAGLNRNTVYDELLLPLVQEPGCFWVIWKDLP